ncbi:hypothetical protein DRN58_01240 [Thermococci archaeon]|nr:MAG: hypothetical protein DRN58_01240 [Thermococci archaeon]
MNIDKLIKDINEWTAAYTTLSLNDKLSEKIAETLLSENDIFTPRHFFQHGISFGSLEVPAKSVIDATPFVNLVDIFFYISKHPVIILHIDEDDKRLVGSIILRYYPRDKELLYFSRRLFLSNDEGEKNHKFFIVNPNEKKAILYYYF